MGGGIAVICTTIAVSLYEGWLPTEESSPVVNMLLTAALPEELFKMVPVFLFAWRSRQWEEPFDGMVYAGATALGFNLIETVLYMISEDTTAGGVMQGVVRGTLGNHLVFGLIMGFFLSRARFSGGGARWKNLALALAVPVALHTAWNASITYGGDAFDGNELAGTFAWGLSTVLWLVAFAYIRANRDASPRNPLAAGLRVAPTGCWQCRAAYPEGAAYCHTCGAQVAQGHMQT